MRVGLVLGAGGLVGHAYHAGVLMALAHHTGWDARDAAIVTGTSAGALTGAMLRLGLSPEDMVARAVGAAPTEAGRALLEAAGDGAPVPPLTRSDVARRRRLPPGVAIARLAVPVHRPRLSTVLCTSITPGRAELSATLAPLARLSGSSWPDRHLWVCAVRRRDATRVVFGQEHRALLADAVAASCAIPGVFRPVRIAGADYIDGAAHSPTNADLVARHTGAAGEGTGGLDAVIAVSPMSALPGAAGGVPGAVRNRFHRWLWRELRHLPGSVPAFVFEPGADELRAMGMQAMDPERAPRVVREAFLAAGTSAALAQFSALVRNASAASGSGPA